MTQKHIEAGRDMPDAPDAPGDDARISAMYPIIEAYAEDFGFNPVTLMKVMQRMLAADPATSRIRALEADKLELHECWIVANEKITALEGVIKSQDETNLALGKRLLALEEKNRVLVRALKEPNDGMIEVMFDAFELALQHGKLGWSAFMDAYDAGVECLLNEVQP